ncbi:MAG: hypothetical protein ABR552_01415 [Actinomycetota bacterium]
MTGSHRTSTDGSVDVKTIDGSTAKPRSDIPLVVTGGPGNKTYTFASDARGIAHVVVPAGGYSMNVPAGCAPRVIVTYGGKGHFGVRAGDRLSAAIQVNATRRFGPGSPVMFTPAEPWSENTDIRFRYTVYDRCTNKEAPNTVMSGLRLVPSGAVRVMSSVLRSDAHAFATLVIRCTAPGSPKLFVRDPQHATDSVDLLSLRLPPPGIDWCD